MIRYPLCLSVRIISAPFMLIFLNPKFLKEILLLRWYVSVHEMNAHPHSLRNTEPIGNIVYYVNAPNTTRQFIDIHQFDSSRVFLRNCQLVFDMPPCSSISRSSHALQTTAQTYFIGTETSREKMSRQTLRPLGE